MQARIFVALFFLLFSISGISQLPNMTLPNVSVHTPDVAELGKYIDYPVNTANGVADVNVSLYTIKSQKLEVPLSLSYHTSGIKVDQEASFVGLGWVLNGGGVVTRIVRGKRDDDMMRGWLVTGNSLPVYNSDLDFEGTGTIGNSTALELQYEERDGEPDLYYVSANGLNGQFCLNNSLEYVSLDQQPTKFSLDHSQNLVIVKDKGGNIYRFGKALDGTPAIEKPSNTTISTTMPGGGSSTNTLPDVVTAYYLTEIISADLSDTIFFKYRNGKYFNGIVSRVCRFFFQGPSYFSTTDALGVQHDGITYSSQGTFLQTQQIPDQILFRNGKVKFNIAFGRQEIQPNGDPDVGGMLKGFEVYDKEDNLYQKVVFDNDGYFNRTGTGAHQYSWASPPEHHKKSLKLDGVKIFDASNNLVSQHSFEYDPTPLPPRNTTSQDFWGYYNGKYNESLIPSTFFTMHNGNYAYYGSNRKTDFNFMKAASLSRINHPTGGYTKYDYEPNYYLTVNQQSNQVQDVMSRKFYAVNRLTTCEPDFLPNIPPNNTVEFTVTESLASGLGTLSVYFTDWKNTNGGYNNMWARVTNLSNNEVKNFSIEIGERTTHKPINTTINIMSGATYRIEMYTNGVTGSNFSICNSPYIEVSISYNYWRTTTSNEIIPTEAGGLRVKRISHYNSDNTIALQKEYSYGDLTYGNGVGQIISDPNSYFYRYPRLYAESSTSGTLHPAIWFASESQTELGMNHGCPVDYPKVVEREIAYGTNASNGKKEYYYSRTQGDFEPKSSYNYPYVTKYFPIWKDKYLSAVKIYKNSGGTDQLLKSTDYTYFEGGVEKIRTAVIHEREPDVWSMTYVMGGIVFWDKNPLRFYYYNYYVSRGRMLLAKEINTTYADNGTSMIDEINYAYNTRFDIRQVTTKDSKGRLTERNFKYTGDLDYTSLINKNIVSLPAQEEVILAEKVKGGSILKYNNDGAVSEQYTFKALLPVTPQPYTVAANIPSYFEKKMSIVYDTDSKNQQELQPADNVKKVYLWSYRNQFPVAEILNADYQTVASVLGAGNILTFKNGYPGETELAAFLAPLRTDTRLSNAKIITYSYNPLLGLLSKRDERNMLTRYEYDSLGRLLRIRDHQNNILKQYEYKFKVNANAQP
ncbi:MAG: hypothetical protein ACTHMC_11815 [Pseudobacter sp.]|uniref:hypothetical protein n=1 Tax=Pseudobacter sp. TaxID=2045420 RepID=UPI003F7DE6C6